MGAVSYGSRDPGVDKPADAFEAPGLAATRGTPDVASDSSGNSPTYAYCACVPNWSVKPSALSAATIPNTQLINLSTPDRAAPGLIQSYWSESPIDFKSHGTKATLREGRCRPHTGRGVLHEEITR